jgi:arsenate reductase
MSSTAIFACVHNAGRSQVAAAFSAALADPAEARASRRERRPAPAFTREIRYEIRRRVADLIQAQGWKWATGR